MDAAATPSGAAARRPRPRLGRRPPAATRPTPRTRSTADRAAAARLDYLALGDWHGTLEIAPRTWYAGTPEPDRFRANDAGNVLLVELDEPGAPARGHAPAHGAPRLAPARASTSPGPPIPRPRWTGCSRAPAGPERAIVQLTLTGVLDLEARTALEPALDRWAASSATWRSATSWWPSPASATC